MISGFNGIFDLAFFPDHEVLWAELAAMAEPEDWSYKKATSSSAHPVLLSFINYSFLRLQEEEALGKGRLVVSDDKKWLCFNTGLVTVHQEPIFVLLRTNFMPGHQPWHFNSFETKSSYELTRFPQLPDMAHYFDDPVELVFDNRLDFRPNVEHIIVDNRERFPDNHKKMNDFELQTTLRGAIENARERVRRNYKAAVPQYHRGGIQLLLPLCLSQPGIADLALVAQRHKTFYRASTCLTLDMAYNNARLIARPDRDWLQP